MNVPLDRIENLFYEITIFFSKEESELTNYFLQLDEAELNLLLRCKKKKILHFVLENYEQTNISEIVFYVVVESCL